MNDINDVFKTIMDDHGFRQSDIARLLGVSPQAVNNRFKEGVDRYRVAEFARILDAMGCRIVIESGTIRRYVI